MHISVHAVHAYVCVCVYTVYAEICIKESLTEFSQTHPADVGTTGPPTDNSIAKLRTQSDRSRQEPEQTFRNSTATLDNPHPLE